MHFILVKSVDYEYVFTKDYLSPWDSHFLWLMYCTSVVTPFECCLKHLITDTWLTHCLETDPASLEGDAGSASEVEGLIEEQPIENGEGEGKWKVVHAYQQPW